MKAPDIVADLQRVVASLAPAPSEVALKRFATRLTHFVERHRATLTFDNFPLPLAAADALCCYELHGGEAAGLTLYLNAIHGGVSSSVHEHGTWAVIVAIEGQERHRIYRRKGPSSEQYELLREVTVRRGEPLVLAQDLFHSMHTPIDRPALQLHVYGAPVDGHHAC